MGGPWGLSFKPRPSGHGRDSELEYPTETNSAPRTGPGRSGLVLIPWWGNNCLGSRIAEVGRKKRNALTLGRSDCESQRFSGQGSAYTPQGLLVVLTPSAYPPPGFSVSLPWTCKSRRAGTPTSAGWGLVNVSLHTCLTCYNAVTCSHSPLSGFFSWFLSSPQSCSMGSC